MAELAEAGGDWNDNAGGYCGSVGVDDVASDPRSESNNGITSNKIIGRGSSAASYFSKGILSNRTASENEKVNALYVPATIGGQRRYCLCSWIR